MFTRSFASAFTVSILGNTFRKKTSNLARAGPINSWKKCAKFPVILELNLHQKNQEGNMFTMCSQVKQGCCEKLWHF